MTSDPLPSYLPDSASGCPGGFFCNPQDVFSTALSIQPCPLGYTLISEGDRTVDYQKSLADTCKKTTPGYYVDHTTWELVDCPEGFYCPEGTTRSTQFPCPSGTYQPNLRAASASDCLT